MRIHKYTSPDICIYPEYAWGCVYIIFQMKLTNYVIQFADCLSPLQVPGFPRFKNCLDFLTTLSG